MSVYREELLLRSKDVDLHRRLRTSRLFELLQEASIRHTEQLGMGRDKTLDKGILWIVGLQRAEIARMPVYDEQIVLKSWPGQTMRFFFPRYYQLETAEGELLLRASALWTLVDGSTRKIVNPESYGVVIEGVTTGEEIPLPSAPPRLEMTESTPFRVPYSYVDLNGHMNNTRYFDLAEDCIPASLEGRPLRLIQTEYVSEARCGDELHVRWGCDRGVFFLLGEGAKPVFRMRLEYGRDPETK
jgi:acyl-ACP thioesterase